MELDNPLIERLDPLLRPTIAQNVADVEPPTYERAVDIIHELLCLKRAKQEIIPDILKANLDSGALYRWNQLLDGIKRRIVGFLVGRFLIDHAWNHQHSITPDCLSVL